MTEIEQLIADLKTLIPNEQNTRTSFWPADHETVAGRAITMIQSIRAVTLSDVAAIITARRDAYASSKAPGWEAVVHEADQYIAAIGRLLPK